MKIAAIIPIFLEGESFMPDILEEGKLYISEHWGTAIHWCACGCLMKTVTPLGKGEWTLVKNGNLVSLTPSIGNFTWEKPNYHAHYFITDNIIKWC